MRNESIFLMSVVKSKDKRQCYLTFVGKGLRREKDLSAKDELLFEIYYAKTKDKNNEETYDKLYDYIESLSFSNSCKLRNIVRKKMKDSNREILNIELVNEILEGKRNFIEEENKLFRKENRKNATRSKNRSERRKAEKKDYKVNPNKKIIENFEEESKMENNTENLNKENMNGVEEEMKKENINVEFEVVEEKEKENKEEKKGGKVKGFGKSIVNKIREGFRKVKEEFKHRIETSKEIIKHAKQAKKAYKEGNEDEVLIQLNEVIEKKKELKFGLIKLITLVRCFILKAGIKVTFEKTNSQEEPELNV